MSSNVQFHSLLLGQLALDSLHQLPHTLIEQRTTRPPTNTAILPSLIVASRMRVRWLGHLIRRASYHVSVDADCR